MAHWVPSLDSLLPKALLRHRRWRTALAAQQDFFRLAREYSALRRD